MNTKPQSVMTPRERVVRAIEFHGPDRLPIWPRFEGTAWIRHGRALIDLMRRYPIDLGGVPATVPTFDHQPLSWTDAWGCEWRRSKRGWFGEAVGHPLAGRDAFEQYVFPDWSGPEWNDHFAAMERNAAAADPERFRSVDGAGEYGVLWYRCWWLRGMAEALADTADDDGFIETLVDRIVESRLTYLRRVVRAEADGVTFGDCWGSQNALMIAPDRWRQVFKPAYKRLFDAVHEAGKYVILETDGDTGAILDDWREIGVDVLSVQLNVVEEAADFRGRLCFYSDPDRQGILPRGTPDQVREHIRSIIDALATPEGGLIGCVYITENEPLENIAAAMDAFVEFGGDID